ncbi:MAG: hypothetical protein IPN42_00155 [Methylococcaceae bacterium]|nr:hypothetical protein [Methylococcaceae bacterium]
MTQFYRVLVDPNATDRLYLKAPVNSNGREVDPRIFTSGTRYDGELPLKLPLRREGKPVDFNFCDFDLIVTPKHLNEALQELVGDSIQRISIEIEASNTLYEILNVLDTVECVNEEKSEFTKWALGDGRSDKVGQFRMITRLFIDQEKARSHNMFRINEWKIALIVDGQVKSLLEKINVTGIVFQPV